MAPAISPNGWLKLAARRLYAISSPALTLLAPMARPNALSRLPCANGLMPVRISTPPCALLFCPLYQPPTGAAAYFPFFLHHYNWHRPHSALDQHPPISKLNLSTNNLLSL